MALGPILIVDDNPANVKLVSFVLATSGFDVRAAPDAQAALAMLKGFRPRLILMDLQLPGIDGFKLTRRLKAQEDTRDIIIVALTAYAMNGDEERARAAGCDGYISKPIDTAGFPGLISAYLSGTPELTET